jgi:hypothetical protein
MTEHLTCQMHQLPNYRARFHVDVDPINPASHSTY